MHHIIVGDLCSYSSSVARSQSPWIYCLQILLSRPSSIKIFPNTVKNHFLLENVHVVRLSWMIYNSSTACLHFPVLGSNVFSISILCHRGQTVDGDGGTARLSDTGGRSAASDGHGQLVGVGATLLFQLPHTQLQFLVRCDRNMICV